MSRSPSAPTTPATYASSGTASTTRARHQHACPHATDAHVRLVVRGSGVPDRTREAGGISPGHARCAHDDRPRRSPVARPRHALPARRRRASSCRSWPRSASSGPPVPRRCPPARHASPRDGPSPNRSGSSASRVIAATATRAHVRMPARGPSRPSTTSGRGASSVSVIAPPDSRRRTDASIARSRRSARRTKK